MSKQAMRAFAQQATDAYLVKGGFIQHCPTRRHGNGFPAVAKHRTMPRWMVAAIACR